MRFLPIIVRGAQALILNERVAFRMTHAKPHYSVEVGKDPLNSNSASNHNSDDKQKNHCRYRCHSTPRQTWIRFEF